MNDKARKGDIPYPGDRVITLCFITVLLIAYCFTDDIVDFIVQLL